MTSKRRKEYTPIGKNPMYNFYHKQFDRLRLESEILNQGNIKAGINTLTVLWDRNSVEFEIARRVGNENGVYFRGNEEYMAFMPFIKLQLETIDTQFKNWRQQVVNSGHKRPGTSDDVWPVDILEQRLLWEAHNDVTLEELDELQRILDRYIQEQRTKDDNRVLRYGIQGWSKDWGSSAPTKDLINVIKEIDGQQIREHNGLLIIKDERSPYNGMACYDYWRLWKEVRQAKNKAHREAYQRRQKELEERGFSAVKVPEGGAHVVNRSSLPPWPKWAKNYLTDQPDENKKK